MLRIVTYAFPSPMVLGPVKGVFPNRVNLHFYDDILVHVTGAYDGNHFIALPDGELGALIEYGMTEKGMAMPLSFGLSSDYFKLIDDLINPDYSGSKVKFKLYPARYDTFCIAHRKEIVATCEVRQDNSEEYEPSIDIEPGTTTLLLYTLEQGAIEMAVHNTNPELFTVIITAADNGDIGGIIIKIPGGVAVYSAILDYESLVIHDEDSPMAGMVATRRIDESGVTLIDNIVESLRECFNCNMIFLGAIQYKARDAISEARNLLSQMGVQHLLPKPNTHM